MANLGIGGTFTVNTVEDVIVYNLLPSIDAVSFKKDANGDLTPNSRTIILSIKKIVGETTTVNGVASYPSNVIVRWSTTEIPNSASAGTVWGGNPSPAITGISWSNYVNMNVANVADVSNIYIALFVDSQLMDMVTIPVIKDGIDGISANENLVDNSEEAEVLDTDDGDLYVLEKVLLGTKLPSDKVVSVQAEITVQGCTVYDSIIYLGYEAVGSYVNFASLTLPNTGANKKYTLKVEGITLSYVNADANLTLNFINISGGTVTIERVKIEAGSKCSPWCLSENDKRGKDGQSAPFYNEEWYAWSNQQTTVNATTEPTPNSGWSKAISNQSSYAYLWKKLVTYTWNNSTRTYVASGSPQYFRMSGTNGLNINTKGTINYAYNSVNDLPQNASAVGKKAFVRYSSSKYQCYEFTQGTYTWVSGEPASAGDSYTVIDGGNFGGGSLVGHLIQLNTEANQWLDLGQFKGQDGVTYYTHVVWATGVTISGSTVTAITGYLAEKPATDTTHFWMGVYVDTNSADPSSETDPILLQYTWSYTRGVQGEQGKTGRWYYYASEWNASDGSQLFSATDSESPYFKSGNNYYIWKGVNFTDKSMVWINSNGGAPSSSNTNWELMVNDFKYLITKALFTDYAKLGSWVFNGNFMMSEKGSGGNGANGTRGTVAFNGIGSSTGFKPNIVMDALNGQASFGCDKIRFNADGSGYLANGKISWNANGATTFEGTISAGTISGNVNVIDNGKLTVGSNRKIEIIPSTTNWGAAIIGKDTDNTVLFNLGFGYENSQYTPMLTVGDEVAGKYFKVRNNLVEQGIYVSPTLEYKINQGTLDGGSVSAGLQITTNQAFSIVLGMTQYGTPILKAVDGSGNGWDVVSRATGYTSLTQGQMYVVSLDELAHIISDPDWDKRNNWAVMVTRL